MSFFFPSRIARLSYFLRYVAFGLGTWPLASLFEEGRNAPVSLKDFWLFLLGLALVVYWLAYIVRPRCKDIGMRWGWIFLALVPFVNVVFGLILLFSRGKPTLEGEPNQPPEPTAPSGRGSS